MPADIACPYTLVTPAGTIAFNDGSDQQFYIGSIPQGLGGKPIRAPQDLVSFGDGGRSYKFWKGPRHILFEGNFLVPEMPPCPALVTIWNEMEDDLDAALESIADETTDTGTLSWSPTGLGVTRSLTVRCELELDVQPDQNFLTRTFHFGLLADDPAWSESP